MENRKIGPSSSHRVTPQGGTPRDISRDMLSTAEKANTFAGPEKVQEGGMWKNVEMPSKKRRYSVGSTERDKRMEKGARGPMSNAKESLENVKPPMKGKYYNSNE